MSVTLMVPPPLVEQPTAISPGGCPLTTIPVVLRTKCSRAA